MEDMLRIALPVRVFGIEESRANWSSYPVAGWGVAFTLSLEEAKNEVESRRTKGSAWRILEWPACALVGERRSLILVSLVPGALAKVTQRTLPIVLQEFRERLPHDPALRGFLVTATEFPPATAPWRKYRSVPQGPGERLHWVVNETPENRAEALAEVLSFCTDAHQQSIGSTVTDNRNAGR